MKLVRSAILGVLLVGCSASSPSATEDATPEPAPTSTATPVPTSTAAEAPVTIHEPVTVMTGVFEDASPQCNEWNETDATAIRSIPARTGDYACKLCATGEAPELSLARSHAVDPGTYRLRAWVRTRSDLHSPHEATVDLNGSIGTPVAITSAWSRMETTFEVKGNAFLTAKVVSNAAKSECLLVDDVILEKL